MYIIDGNLIDNLFMNLSKTFLIVVLLAGCSLSITDQYVDSGPTFSKLPSLPALASQQILQQALNGVEKDILEYISKRTSLTSPTNQEILQEALEGLFLQNLLPKPTTIIPCIDEDSARLIVDFIGRSLQKLAKGSLSDLLSFIDKLKKFPDQLPQDVKDCLAENSQLQKLGSKYNIDNTTPIELIEKLFINYITLHYMEFHKWVVDVNIYWKAQKYAQSGFDAATYAHKIWKFSANAQSSLDLEQFSKLMSFSIQMKNQIQQTLNQLFQKMNLRSQNTQKIVDLV